MLRQDPVSRVLIRWPGHGRPAQRDVCVAGPSEQSSAARCARAMSAMTSQALRRNRVHRDRVQQVIVLRLWIGSLATTLDVRGRGGGPLSAARKVRSEHPASLAGLQVGQKPRAREAAAPAPDVGRLEVPDRPGCGGIDLTCRIEMGRVRAAHCRSSVDKAGASHR